MTKSKDERPGRDLTFEEMQELEPERKKRDDRWHQFRIVGIYISGAGFSIILLMWSFQSSFSKTSGISTPISQMPLYVVAPVIVGAAIASLGALLFARGQIALNKSHRDFMKAMAVIIEKDQKKK